jgi:hypothetical protein
MRRTKKTSEAMKKKKKDEISMIRKAKPKIN